MKSIPKTLFAFYFSMMFLACQPSLAFNAKNFLSSIAKQIVNMQKRSYAIFGYDDYASEEENRRAIRILNEIQRLNDERKLEQNRNRSKIVLDGIIRSILPGSQ